MIVNIKDFDFSLLKIYKLSYKGWGRGGEGGDSLNIYYIKYIPTKNLNHMNVDHDKDFLYLFLDDIDDHIEEKDGIKYLVFTPTEKSKEALRNYKKF